MLDGAPEQRLVARGGDLRVGGQAGGIDVGRPRHAERARFCSHARGELFFATGHRFGDDDGGVVRRFRDQTLDRILDVDCLVGFEPELGRVLQRCAR